MKNKACAGRSRPAQPIKPAIDRETAGEVTDVVWKKDRLHIRGERAYHDDDIDLK
jgi:hypothetical protein